MIRVNCDSLGKLNFFVEYTTGLPAHDIINRKIKNYNVKIFSIGLLKLSELKNDCILAFIKSSSASQSIRQFLKLRSDKVIQNGYQIKGIKCNGKNLLVIIGGDLFGMLAGLADVLSWSEIDNKCLRYRGGERLENPAFPLRYYWTWDHSTNWVLDDEGNQVNGCANQYLKKPETFLEDYKRLIDHCIEMRFNGIVIWGFLRDAHGGEKYAEEIARYASNRGVAIMPGVGTTGYGGVYYDGDHPCNLETYLSKNPKLGNMWQDGQISKREISPYYPQNQKWIRESIEWLCRTFPIGGVNLENNDFMVDYSPAGVNGRKKVKSKEKDCFKDQYFAYKTALEVVDKFLPNGWNTYATYSGFGMGADVVNAGADVGAKPYFSTHMPKSAIAQWTLSGMLLPDPLPLRTWMDSPKPRAVYQNKAWPIDLVPPTPRSCGFIHQASQWSGIRRNMVAISTFAEACLRAYESGLEGISIHGEVTYRTLCWKLNYLAMRHWTYHPESTLIDFADMELANRVGGQKEARLFVEYLCRLEEKTDYSDFRNKTAKIIGAFYPYNYPARGNHEISRMWYELDEWFRFASMDKCRLRGMTDLL